MYKVTIITTTYNQEKYIKQSLDSFIMQETNFSFQILVSDDCSTDNTREIINSYKIKYPDIIKPIFNDKNLGPMNNFIETLSKASTEYVALCDGDDFWTDKHKLQKQVDFMDSNKDYSICFHRTKIFFENNDAVDQIYPTNINIDTNFDDLIRLRNYIPANTVLYRWAYFNPSRSLKSEFPADIVPGDYYLHLIHAKKGKIRYIDEIMSCYRRHNNGMWWLNALPEGKEKFSLIYNKQLLNFYDEIEKNFNVNPSEILPYKKDIITNAIVSYIKNDLIENLDIFKNNPENNAIFNICIKNIVENNLLYINYLNNKDNEREIIKRQSIDEFYYSLNKFKKIIYLLFIDQVRLHETIKKKLYIYIKHNKK